MAFYYQAQADSADRLCDHAGCDGEGLYRAPKSRGNLRDYHWFCLDHVRSYNRSWNYCEGMSENEIEHEIRSSTTWERPTWKPSGPAGYEERIRQTIHDSAGFYGFGAGEFTTRARKVTPESRALETLGLEDGVTFADIKAKYRSLVKQHHPDINRGNAEAEERLKTINHAFNTLKRAHKADKVA